MYAISVSPSLLPRRWWYHGLVSGVLMAVGYATGWFLATVGAAVLGSLGVSIVASPLVVQWTPWIFAAGFGLWVIRSVVLAYRSSLSAAELVGMRAEKLPEYLRGLVASLVLAFWLTLIVMGLVWVHAEISDLLGRWITRPLAGILVAIAGLFLLLLFSNRVVLRAILVFFARDAAKRNNRTALGISAPQVAERSGSPQSLCSWESVGAQGRTFLGRGPGKAKIEQITGRSAQEPVRVYAGMPADGRDFASETRLIIAEMHRTRAFERRVILISVATGSGWVDEWAVQPVEYLTRGNCATVSMQYSYLFSAAIMLSEMDACRTATIALFEAVRAEIDSLPLGKRPLLFLSGESLGAEAAQYPFRDFLDMVTRVDGALLVGSPSTGPILRELTAARHHGSPEVAPVYDSARQARFVAVPENLDRDLFGRDFGRWEYPRVVFAQHASDPVVWYSPRLTFTEPDWLRERVGLDVTPKMRYTYLATYWQVACDMPMAGTAPGGHGHTYNEELIPAWVKLLGIDDPASPAYGAFMSGVTPEYMAMLGQVIRADMEESGRR